MATKPNPHVKVDTYLRGVAIVLKSAACEWLLLFFLLLDAAFSYFLTKFAQYCDLQVPCILCSRLDHVFEKEAPDLYRNLLCNHHKSELSSLVLCQNHGKLSDVHETCEECLLSFARKDPEMHKLLVGKLRLDCLQKPFLSMDTHMRSCSCCTKPWRSRPNVQMSVQSKLASNASKPDIPLPKSPVHKCLNRSEGLKKKKGQFGPSPLMAGQKESDFRSHVVYSKEKVISDSESDFHFSDDDVLQKNNVRDEYRSHLGPNSPKRLYDDFFPPGLLHRTLDASILMNSDDEPEKGETTTPTCLGANGDGRQFFTEPNLQQHISSMKPSPPTTTLAEFNSLDDVPLSSNAPEITPIVVPDGVEKVSHSKNIGPSGLSDRVSHNNAAPSTNIQVPHGPSNEKWSDTKENGDVHHVAPATNNWESIDLDTTSVVLGKVSPKDIRNELASKPNSSAFDDLASTTNKHAQTSTLLHPEPLVRTDCNGTTESSSSSNETPITSQTPPESHTNHTIVNNGHVVPVPFPVSVVSSNPQSTEGPHIHESFRQAFGEANCEKLINKLRRQLEYSTKCIENLYKELEEERNAASIAANQAMAMINKLQEEKAALNMESLQYLRMMEEQAEYDMEALDRANDMIAEKEREIDELQADLDLFRIKYPDDFPEDQGNEEMEGESEEIDESNMDTVDFES